MVEILFRLPWSILLWVIKGVVCISWTVCEKIAPIIFFFSAQRDKSKCDQGELLIQSRIVISFPELPLLPSSTEAFILRQTDYIFFFEGHTRLFVLFFATLFKPMLSPPPVIPGSLRGVTRSWQRWSTCCSTTSPLCRPMQPRTCSTYATVIIESRQKWVVEH